MKKLVGIAVAGALLAASAFAEVGISGWGRGIWAPIGYDGDLKMTHGTSWANVERVGVTVAGNSDNIGFVFAFHADGGSIGIHDVANVWAKPWDWLKISVGKILDDTLRVNNEFGQYKWLRAGAGNVGEDLTFRRIGGYGGYKAGGDFNGAEIALTPVDGLYIAAGFKIDTTDFVDVLKMSQYAAGYKIEGLLAVKAQYIGIDSKWASEGMKDNDGKDVYELNSSTGKVESVKWFPDGGEGYYGIINAAVDLLMIENNFISIGAYIPTDFDRQIAISAVYNGWFDALSLKALVGVMLEKGEEWTGEKCLNTGLEIGVGVGYDLGNGLAIEGDVRTELFFHEFEDRDAHGDISVGAFFTKGFSNGKCGIGAELAVPFGKAGGWKNSKENNTVGMTQFATNDKVHFAIPVMVEFSF